jgi:AraC family transcriptional regulator
MRTSPGPEVSPLAHLTLAHSSVTYPWNGFLLEHHRMPEGERPEVIANQHVLWLWATAYSGEYAAGGGRFVRCSKGPGALTLTPAGIVPTLRSYGPSEVVLCALETGFVENIRLEADRLRAFTPVTQAKFQDSAVRRLIALLMEELQAGAPTGKLYADSLAFALGMRFVRLAEGAHRHEMYSRVSALPLPALRRVIERMKCNIGTDLTLASLAAESGYSRAHFLRMFRAATAQTPHQYLISLRLENAVRMMKERSTPLIDIAVACGFSSHTHFTKVFRSKFGVLPSQYRRDSNSYSSGEALDHLRPQLSRAIPR